MPINQALTPQDVVDFFNLALVTDPEAVTQLMTHRVKCVRALAEHPTIQVRQMDDDGLFHDVGMLGLLNGLFGVFDEEGPHKGWGPFVAQYDDASGKLLGFALTPVPPKDEHTTHGNAD